MSKMRFFNSLFLLITTLCISIVLLMLLFDIKTSVFIVFLLIPLLVYFIFSTKYNHFSYFNAGSLIMVFYGLFFFLRGSQILINENTPLEIPFASAMDSYPVIIGVSVSMLLFVIGYISNFNQKAIFLLPEFKNKPINNKRILFFAMFFVLLSYLGLLLLIIEYGGVQGIINRYILHTKIFESSAMERFGILLWTTFNPIGVWLTGIVFANSKKKIFLIPLTLIVILSMIIPIVLFGSRTQLLPILIGGGLIFHWRIKKIPNWWIIVSLPLLFVVSLWIVSYRTIGGVASFSINDIIENLGHNIIDVMIAINKAPVPLKFITSLDRWLALPISLIPRIFWPAKPILSITRLDWLIANYYREGIVISNTGYPSSIFSEWFLLGGWPLASVAGFVFGLISGIVDRWFYINSRSNAALIIYIPMVTSIVYYFKDGDIVMSASSSIKIIIFCVIIAFLSELRIKIKG